MKFCLLVTVALDIFIKEKNNILYFPWISPLSFSYGKGDPPLIITFVEHTSGAGISSVLIPILHFIDATTPEKGCVFLLYSFLKSK